VLANLMFSLSAVSISTHDRATGAHFLSEVVATAGLTLVIFCWFAPDETPSCPQR
jgi:arsenate reductase